VAVLEPVELFEADRVVLTVLVRLDDAEVVAVLVSELDCESDTVVVSVVDIDRLFEDVIVVVTLLDPELL
jgi:hypothetical protein